MIAIIFDGTNGGFDLLKKNFICWKGNFKIIDEKFFVRQTHHKKIIKAKSRAPCITIYKYTSKFDDWIEIDRDDLLFARDHMEPPVLIKNNRRWFIETKEFIK